MPRNQANPLTQKAGGDERDVLDTGSSKILEGNAVECG